MSNPKKKFDFENSFAEGSRSPKRPKLEVIQRPSGNLAINETFENADDNEDLWGDELETDAVEEVLLLESQACSLKPQISSSHIADKISSGPSAVFQPKTSVLSSARGAYLGPEPTSSSKPSGSGAAFKGSSGPFAAPASASHAVQQLTVEKVKTNVIGKGCQRSSSFPAVAQTSSSTRTPWVEGKGFKERLPTSGIINEGSSTKSSTDETQKKLKEEVEKLKAETLTKSGEAALLRQRIKDAGLELEKERQNRTELLEKMNQKHQEEMAALRRELEAAKTQLQFKEHDVDDALEKCKLLQSGAMKVRPLDVASSSPSRPSTSSKQLDFPNRSSFEGNTPKIKPDPDKIKVEEEVSNEMTTEKMAEALRPEAIEAEMQTEATASVGYYNCGPQLSEGLKLSNMIVPYWFEMESSATEEQFDGRWEGVSIVTDLIRMNSLEGETLQQMVNWCWHRLIDFISDLKQKREEDLQFDQKKEESRRQYEEWCLDRRIPLPPQKSEEDEGFQNEWFAEDSTDDELQSFLSYRPWCPNDSIPEMRRTFALATALMKASKHMARAFGSHNVKEDSIVLEDSNCKEEVKRPDCFVCSCSIKDEDNGECLRDSEGNEDSKETACSIKRKHSCESFEKLVSESLMVKRRKRPLLRMLKGNQKSSEGETEQTLKEDNLDVKKTSVTSSKILNDEKNSSSSVGDELQSKGQIKDGLQIKLNEADQKSHASNDNVTVSEADQKSNARNDNVTAKEADKKPHASNDNVAVNEADQKSHASNDNVIASKTDQKANAKNDKVAANEADKKSPESDDSMTKNEEVDPEIKNMLTFDFLHLVGYICRVISQMRRIIPMEGTLASILVFLTILNQQITLSKRGLLQLLEVIKEILFIRPRLSLLVYLMRLLISTAHYPIILQKLCVNAGPNAAYRDRWKNIWFFTRDACPLQILITILENVTDERIPDGISKEAWFMYRAKLGHCFIRWLTIALGQKGHHVSWLCCAVVEDIHEELKEEMNIPLNTDDPNDSKQKERAKDSETAEATSNTSTAETKMEAEGNEGASVLDMPTKSFFNWKRTGSDDEEIEWDEKEPICCCRRWTMNIITNYLYTILSDFEVVIQGKSKEECLKDENKLPFKKRLPKKVNKKLLFEQSRIIRLGIFVLRELLRRGHPEFNATGGEGFLWNHYTIKGTVLANGQVMTKQYDHKNCEGGPIGGRYLVFLTKLQKGLKNRIYNFCPKTEKAFKELLEENCKETNSVAQTDDTKFWDQIEKLGHI